MKAEIKVVKTWIKDGDLFIKAECPDRETLTEGIRSFAKDYVADPKNNLQGWSGNTGIEKTECPGAYDVNNPDTDVMELAKKGVKINYMYTQVVRINKGI